MAAKNRDIPSEIRPFNKLFERLTYRFDTSRVFDDYLTYCIYVFNTERDPQELERIKDTYKDDYTIFPEAFREHVICMDKMVFDGGWYDMLGTFYEAVLSPSKASAFGQFFTPASVCDFMASLNGADNERGMGKRVNDPACGSGRTLLAFHAKAPGNFMFGDDLDPMCTKMAAINFVMHGAVGQVCNMNSLSLDDWRFGYDINPELYKRGLVSLRPITKEQSFSLSHWQQVKQAPIVENVRKDEPPVIAPEAQKQHVLGNQLTFF